MIDKDSKNEVVDEDSEDFLQLSLVRKTLFDKTIEFTQNILLKFIFVLFFALISIIFLFYRGENYYTIPQLEKIGYFSSNYITPLLLCYLALIYLYLIKSWNKEYGEKSKTFTSFDKFTYIAIFISSLVLITFHISYYFINNPDDGSQFIHLSEIDIRNFTRNEFPFMEIFLSLNVFMFSLGILIIHYSMRILIYLRKSLIVKKAFLLIIGSFFVIFSSINLIYTHNDLVPMIKKDSRTMAKLTSDVHKVRNEMHNMSKNNKKMSAHEFYNLKEGNTTIYKVINENSYLICANFYRRTDESRFNEHKNDDGWYSVKDYLFQNYGEKCLHLGRSDYTPFNNDKY